MAESLQDKETRAQTAIKNKKSRESLVADLASNSRKDRQNAAGALALVAHEKPQVLAEHIEVFIQTLDRPEAQTRWETLNALTNLVEVDASSCEQAFDGAETALFDEESGPLQLAAMRFLCKIGATSKARSERAWPLIDEGIQCYHGNLEFLEMMAAVIGFASGNLAPEVKEALIARVRFDAENNTGLLQRRAQEVLDVLGN